MAHGYTLGHPSNRQSSEKRFQLDGRSVEKDPSSAVDRGEGGRGLLIAVTSSIRVRGHSIIRRLRQAVQIVDRTFDYVS